jgi:ribosomal protein S1
LSSSWASRAKAFWSDRNSTSRRTSKIGDEVRVLLEDVEGDTGLVKISKRKADRIINWETIMQSKKEGNPVSGKVTKKIKGGLLVDIGVPVFLPASQVDIRRPGEISDWIGRTSTRSSSRSTRSGATSSSPAER